MNQNLHLSGVTLLNALSKHADLIMQVYLSGHLDESKVSQGVVEKLIKLGVCFGVLKQMLRSA